MPRYNSSTPVSFTTTSSTLTSPATGFLNILSGTSGYSVTLPNPVLYSGQSQKFYNITGGNVTLVTPSGTINGPTATNVANYTIGNGAVVELTSNGTDYVVTSSTGGAISATTGTFSSTLTANGAVSLNPANFNVAISPTGTGTVTISPVGALTINPTAASTINNTSIGASTRSTGAFTTLTANNAVTFTQNTASSGTTSGTLVVTGGMGVSDAIYAGSIQNTPIGNTTRSTGAFTTLTSNSSTTFTANTASSTTTSGTLVVTGGVGISGNIYVGGLIVAQGGTSGIIGHSIITTNSALVDADSKYIVANTGVITVTLPATTTNGRTITLVDGNNFTSFNVVVGRNGRNIGGVAEDLILNLQGSKVDLVYYNSDWKVFAV